MDAAVNGWRTYDNFSLASSAVIGQATWYGIYLDSALANGTPNTSSWQVSFYADAAGVPGAQLSNTTLNLADVTVQNLGTGFSGGSRHRLPILGEPFSVRRYRGHYLLVLPVEQRAHLL